MRHLRDLYNQFGDWHLALAAYNVGAGGVSKRIRKSGKSNPSYWEIRTLLPKETAFYVPLFIAAAKISMEPEKYGFDMDSLSFQKEYKYDIYTLKEPTNLNSIASSCGISLDSLKSLNPELIKATTPIDWAEYRIKLPYGSVMKFASNFQRMTSEEKSALSYS
jgi:membrane-bound lytic murein transglycosylase D